MSLNFSGKLLTTARPLTKLIGKIHAPYSHKLIRGKQYNDIKNYLKPGDVVLSRTRGELTNLFIPGFWSHAGHYIEQDGERYVIEAVGNGVQLTPLVEFMLTKDYFGAYRPIFCGETAAKEAALISSRQVGVDYDYAFYFTADKTNKSFYCIELPMWSFNMVLGPAMPFKPREVFGALTYAPQDIADATKLWRPVAVLR